MSKILKTRNLSATQTFQYFKTQNINQNDSDKLKLEDIRNIYNFLYDDNFCNILIQSKDMFLNYIEFNIKDIIQYHFDEIYINTTFFQQTLNKYKKEIEDKYNNDFSILNEEYQTNKNNIKEKQRKYLSHFVKHCINTCQYAYHHCPNNKKGQFILVEDKNNKIKNKTPEIKYVICFDCKECYPSKCIKMICTPCNYEYYSAVLKENEDPNILLATWEKYHCGGSLQDQVMKCIKCKKELYINLTTNKLICKNCKFESKPNSILWKCYFCSQDFRSKVKVYNPLEFENMKKAINNALIMKIKANPKILPCCKKETKDLIFYHKEECKGILFKGFLNGKEILVCKKCHAMNFIDKYHWICPLCGKKFHLHHATSITHYRLIRNSLNKENINNNNSGKKSTRIFFSLRKDNSNLFNKELENEPKINQKENINSLNKIKDENISYNLNTHINSYKNIRSNDNNKNKEEKDGKIKIIKIPQKDKNNSEIRSGHIIINKDSSIEIEKDERAHKHKKKKRKTLYEILENKKKISNNNISLKNTIESVLVEKNFNKTKNFNDEKLNVGNKENENDINILSQTSLLPNQKNVFSNKDGRNRKYYDTKINDYIDIDVREKEKKLNTYKKIQTSQDKHTNRNNNNINFMNSSDDLLRQKELIKCKSYNIFNNEKNNENNISNRNNNLNHQTNYLYTTNSNYNIKVTLNINHNICPYPKKDDDNNLKKEAESNYKKIYNNAGLNKINQIYLHEILNNSKSNIDKQILVNNSNNEKNLDNKKNIKNNNIINKSKNLGYLSPKNNSNSEFKLINSTKKDNAQNIGNVRRKKEMYYNTSNNANKNSFLNSNKIKESKNLKKDFNLKSEHNTKNEPKKLIFNNKFNNILNKNNISSPNIIINPENKIQNKNNLNYINVKEKEINNSKINDNKNSIKDISIKNLKNKDKEEITKKEEETKKIKTILSKLDDMERTTYTILNTTKKNVVNDQFKYDLMKNVIVSPETISQLTKESIIPNFNDKDFRYVRPIGEGAYGLIYLVENIHNRKQFALKKILCKDLYDIMKYKNQFELIYSINHKNLMEIYNLQYKYLDNTTYAIYVLMERAQNDWSIDIRKRIINKKPYKEEEIINILKQVVSALSYLQKKNIAHRDIKPQNILLFPGNIFKIADLGEARNVNDVNNKQMTLRGSELYMSPSLYARHKFNRKDAFHNAYKSDVFSLGFSTLYAMNLNLRVIENIRELNNMKIIINSIQKDMGKRIYSEKLMKIIYKMIEIDENKRYDFIELEKDLNSNF